MLVSGGAIPIEELREAKKSECALALAGRSVCALRGDLELMRRFLRQHDSQAGTYPPRRLVQEVQRRLGVGAESAIWEHPEFRRFTGGARADDVLVARYKPPGPHDSTRLLDNENIDWNLEQWAVNGKEQFGRVFHHVPYQMLDFERQRSALATLDLKALRAKGADCFGVVLNTDVTAGPGKHWFCLFGELRGKGTQEDPWLLEYFNSSGNPPRPEVEAWMGRVRRELLLEHDLYCEIVRSAPQRLQYSNTECGMWSLLYIYCRLKGKKPEWFYAARADDEDMVKARQSLFRPDTRGASRTSRSSHDV
jgi:hypothetical protein